MWSLLAFLTKRKGAAGGSITAYNLRKLKYQSFLGIAFDCFEKHPSPNRQANPIFIGNTFRGDLRLGGSAGGYENVYKVLHTYWAKELGDTFTIDDLYKLRNARHGTEKHEMFCMMRRVIARAHELAKQRHQNMRDNPQKPRAESKEPSRDFYG